MARTLVVTELDDIKKLLSRGLQSGNLSILLGSGASSPAIAIAGSIEEELNKLIVAKKSVEYDEKIREFLTSIQASTNALIDTPDVAPHAEVLKNYRDFLQHVSEILEARRTRLLSKQATIFSTNYDMFVERATEDLPMLRLNDGFQRNPSTDGRFKFRSDSFLEVTHSTGNLFNYEFAIPTINLVKLHGSLTWAERDDDVISRDCKLVIPIKGSATYAKDMVKFVENFILVVPTKAKFEKTIIDRTYYDLLRLFANRLDLENSLLLAFGFSFNDQHILDITKRALKNPTLLLVIFAHGDASAASYQGIFGAFNNVVIVAPAPGSNIDFGSFNSLISSVKPKFSHDSR